MDGLEIAGLVVGVVIGVLWLVLEWQTGVRLRNIETEMRRLNEVLRVPASKDEPPQ